jgi:hypothetical protein
MQLLITTQTQENYGAHDWDGTGTCPSYWKFKGGQDYKYSLGTTLRNSETIAEIVEHFRSEIEEDNDYYRNHIIGFEVVADDYLTEFEQSQLEYDGRIAYPATRLTMKEIA